MEALPAPAVATATDLELVEMAASEWETMTIVGEGYTSELLELDIKASLSDLSDYSTNASVPVPAHMVKVAVSVDDRVSADELVDDGSRISCTMACTTIVVPVQFAEDNESPSLLASWLLQRQFTDANTGATVKLWEPRHDLPVEANELAQHFQRQTGTLAGADESLQRLRVTREAMNMLFPQPRLHAVGTNESLILRHVQWSAISLLICNHASLLMFQLDWAPPGYRFTLEELRVMVYLCKFPNVRPGVFRGWTFNVPRLSGPPPYANELRAELGDKLYRARHEDDPVSLATLCNWLVKAPFEPRTAPCRVELFTFLVHHTCAQLPDAFVAGEDANVLMVRHIAMQEGAANRYDMIEGDAAVTILRPRSNRMFALAVNGVLAMEWSGSTEFFPLARGVYQFLAMHVMAERAVLVRLMLMAALGARGLHDGSDRHVETLHDKAEARAMLLRLCTSLVKYNLSMSSDECGGRSTFRVFFKTLRKIHGVESMRLELREGLTDTMALVESDYQEQSRIQKEHQHVLEQRLDAAKHKRDGAQQRQKDLVSLCLTIVATIVLPFNIMSGLFGMNNTDLPADTSWSGILIFTAVACVALCIIVILVYCCTGPSRAVRHEVDVERARLNQVSASTGVVSAYIHEPGTTHGQLFVAKGSAHFGAIQYDPDARPSLINWAKLKLVQRKMHKVQRAEKAAPLVDDLVDL